MKETAVIIIRNWVRTNGNMSDDGEFITYSCKKLEEVIAQAIEMEKKQIINACEKFGNLNGVDIEDYQQYYNETYIK